MVNDTSIYHLSLYSVSIFWTKMENLLWGIENVSLKTLKENLQITFWKSIFWNIWRIFRHVPERFLEGYLQGPFEEYRNPVILYLWSNVVPQTCFRCVVCSSSLWPLNKMNKRFMIWLIRLFKHPAQATQFSLSHYKEHAMVQHQPRKSLDSVKNVNQNWIQWFVNLTNKFFTHSRT